MLDAPQTDATAESDHYSFLVGGPTTGIRSSANYTLHRNLPHVNITTAVASATSSTARSTRMMMISIATGRGRAAKGRQDEAK